MQTAGTWKPALAWIALAAVVTFTASSSATVLRALGLSELVSRSNWAVVAEPLDAHSVWETIAGSERIVTYRRVRVAQAVFGDVHDGDELIVQTLGGSVDGIAQIVHGEARLSARQPALLLLRRVSGGVARVTGMAQGHLPCRVVDGKERVQLSPYRPALLGPSGSAVTALAGQPLTRVVATLRRLREAQPGQPGEPTR